MQQDTIHVKSVDVRAVAEDGNGRASRGVADPKLAQAQLVIYLLVAWVWQPPEGNELSQAQTRHSRSRGETLAPRKSPFCGESTTVHVSVDYSFD